MEHEIMSTGIGGQGVQLAAQILARAATLEDRQVMYLGTYGGTMRGGNTDTTIVIADGHITLLDIDAAAVVDPTTPSGTALDVIAGSNVFVGTLPCSGDNWNFEASGPAIDTRLASFDLAGNFSGWSDPQQVAPPDLGEDPEVEANDSDTVSGCGCRLARSGTGAGATFIGLAALLLLGLGLRRSASTAA